MSSEKHMLGAAKQVTGDDIRVAGLFSPQADTDYSFAGWVLGDVVGEAIDGDVGSLIGMGVGDMAGHAADKYAASKIAADDNDTSMEGGTLSYVMAVSPTKAYLLQSESPLDITRENLELAYSFDLASLAVTLHRRVSVRAVMLEDTASGDKLELVGHRSGFSHSKQTIRYLLDQVDAAHEELEASDASAVG